LAQTPIGPWMKILVTGASGQLGAYLLDELSRLSHTVVAWSGTRADRRGLVDLVPVDLADLDALEPALDRYDPGAVIHSAAISSAEAVRLDRPRADLVNVRATRRIVEWAESHRRRFVFTSTDLVFDGTRPLRREADPAEPVLAYGQTKRAAELAVLAFPSAVVARLPILFGLSRSGRSSFFDRAIEALQRGEPQTFFDDEYRSPLDYRSAARGLIQLASPTWSGRPSRPRWAADQAGYSRSKAGLLNSGRIAAKSGASATSARWPVFFPRGDASSIILFT